VADVFCTLSRPCVTALCVTQSVYGVLNVLLIQKDRRVFCLIRLLNELKSKTLFHGDRDGQSVI
jgi:hypothetical protein